jgi:signal peptidase I
MRTWFRIVFWVGGVLGAVLLALYLLFFDVWRVPADDPLLAASIEPTLSAGDLVVVTRRTSITRGNLLRCADPQAPGRFVVGRALGRFGDHVEIRDEVVAIDGSHDPSPRRCEPPTMTIHDPRTDEDVVLDGQIEENGESSYCALISRDHPEPPTQATVEPGRWYLVSDDRHVHLDSRDFGPNDPTTCQHIVLRIESAAGFGDDSARLTVIW